MKISPFAIATVLAIAFTLNACDSGGGGNVDNTPKCNGESYNPSTQVCYHNSLILSKCGNDEDEAYMPECAFCYNSKSYSKCGYNYDTRECGSIEYDPSRDFCYACTSTMLSCTTDDNYDTYYYYKVERLYSKCNGNEYDPLKKFCYLNNLYDKCKSTLNPVNFGGGVSYNPSTQKCSNGNVVPLY
jgi:hypothetical protein